ncbi:hypothetical protein EGI22_16190 [Lacihabitans sp. LS3-19]|uniref:hypothetical protein n=1 Tax=Lacihabitans sp. LS3-19 TaxID=2487335 RepID=UPI0020CBB8E3|nr:hypothetical protein [Lacihabitans sp. LS3-19]MCP9769444.1 hypothetical protein [Lacihabitans sp. LS3-19]
MDKNKLISLFEKQVMPLPDGFDISIFEDWFEKIYMNPKINPIIFIEVFEYVHNSLEIRKPNNRPPLRVTRILPNHSKIIDAYFDLVNDPISPFENSLALNQTVQNLIFEIFTLEIEIHQAIILRNEYLNTPKKTIQLYLKTLEEANSFKNFKPKDILLNDLDCSKVIHLNCFGPVIYESLMAEIEHYKIEVKKVRKILSNRKVKTLIGIDINLSIDQLKKLFIEFRDNLKYIHIEANECDFIASLSGDPIPTTFNKIEWLEAVKLAIFIGENVENKYKWRKCEYLFKNTKDLRKKYDSAKKFSPFIKTVSEIETVMKKIRI